MPDEIRICRICGESKPLEEFTKPSFTFCKVCANAKTRAWRQEQRRIVLASLPPKLPVTEKRCKRCEVVQPLENFYKQKNGGWYHSYCKPCFNARVAEMRKLMPSSRDSEKLKYKTKRMGTTPEWFNETLANQKGLCAICKRPESHPIKKGGAIRALAIDHDHITGKVRGLLCFRCNTSVHLLDQCGLEWAENAVRYMKGQGETC